MNATSVPSMAAARSVERKASGVGIPFYQFLEPRFVNGDFTSPETLYFGDIVVHAGDRIAAFSKTGPSDQSNVTRSHNRDSHA